MRCEKAKKERERRKKEKQNNLKMYQLKFSKFDKLQREIANAIIILRHFKTSPSVID